MTRRRSPWLDLPGAVEDDGADAGLPLHLGDPLREQRRFVAGEGVLDRSNREVLRLTGEDRTTWLHSLTTQHLTSLAPGVSTTTLVLSPQGRVEHVLQLVDDATATWVHVEPGAAAGLVAFLTSMRFMTRVEIEDVTDAYAVVTVPAGSAVLTDPALAGVARTTSPVGVDLLVPRGQLASLTDLLGPVAGTWAYEALRVAAHVPRQGFETDEKTLPHEVGWIGTAVHLDKGCYRGQETVARVHNVGHPPRRLVMLHLDGSVEVLPAHGDPVELDGVVVGTVTSAARHHELGPIALALVKRTVPVDADLVAGGVAAGQEVVVPPDAGLGLGAKLREEFSGRRSLM